MQKSLKAEVFPSVDIEEMNRELNEPETLDELSSFLTENGKEPLFVKKIDPTIIKSLDGEEVHLHVEATNALGEDRPQLLVFRIKGTSSKREKKDLEQKKIDA